jgi:7,8-dihydro-6-hydroxymethylpterin-pyrophosphokinase
MTDDLRRAFVSLGSNLGDREALLRAGREALSLLPATRLLAASRVYDFRLASSCVSASASSRIRVAAEE